MNTPKTTSIDWLREQVQSNLSEPMSPKFAELFDRAREMQASDTTAFADDYADQVMAGMNKRASEYYDDIYGKSE